MKTDTTYTIRPAGRHLFTIGRDLIQDNYAAVVELVKNAYDADSPDVNIDFRASADGSGYTVVISDRGHGMSREDVINKWMVPSTLDKRERGRSPHGRKLQGSKGVGRYAASVLGTDLLLETVTPEGEKTTVYLEWGDFEAAQYLDDVEILVETERVSEPQGTRLTMTGNDELLAEWDKKRLEKLQFELRKMKSPASAAVSTDEFRINLTILGFPHVKIKETIEPYPLFDLFDYKISGDVNADGKGVIKVRAKNRWEAQLDQSNGDVLQVAYRRSDIIESIHDGSFFHDRAKLGLFLPASIVLFVLSLTGIYMFFQRQSARRRNRPKKKRLAASRAPSSAHAERDRDIKALTPAQD